MFEVKILENSKYLWVELKGKLMTEENGGEMFNLICDKLSENRSIVILNLLNLEYINSSGFNNILKILTNFSACLTERFFSIILFATNSALFSPTKIFACPGVNF